MKLFLITLIVLIVYFTAEESKKLNENTETLLEVQQKLIDLEFKHGL